VGGGGKVEEKKRGVDQRSGGNRPKTGRAGLKDLKVLRVLL
jgi:hypothetical protein